MAIYRTNTTELTSIADAIRAKTGSNSSLVYPTGFVSAINSINTNDRPIFTITYDENDEITNITCNKTYNQVYNRVINEDKWDITIYSIETNQDTYNDGSSLYKSGQTLYFYIISSRGIGLTQVNYTSNGNITWNDYWRVQHSSDITTSGNTITIPWGAYYDNITKTITDPNLTAENIKKGVTILGVTGTYEGT